MHLNRQTLAAVCVSPPARTELPHFLRVFARFTDADEDLTCPVSRAATLTTLAFSLALAVSKTLMTDRPDRMPRAGFTSANGDLHEGHTLQTAGHRARAPIRRIDRKPTHTDV